MEMQSNFGGREAWGSFEAPAVQLDQLL